MVVPILYSVHGPRPCVNLVHGGAYILAGTRDGNVELWNSKTCLRVKPYRTSMNTRITSIAVSENNENFLVASEDSKFVLIDTLSGKEICTFKGHANSVRSISWMKKSGFPMELHGKTVNTEDFQCSSIPYANAPSLLPQLNSTVLSASDDSTAALWDIRTGRIIQRLTDAKDCVTSAITDGYSMWTGSLDGYIRSYDARRGCYSETNLKGAITALEYGVWNDVALVSFANRSPLIFDLSIRKVLREIGEAPLFPVVQQGKFFENMEEAILPSFSGSIQIWKLLTGSKEKECQIDNSPILCVDYCPITKQVVCGTGSGRIFTWNLNDETTIESFANRLKTGIDNI